MEFLLGPIAELVFASGHMKSLFIARHSPIEKWFTVVAQNKRRQQFKTTTIFFQAAPEAPTYQAVSPFHLLQMPNDHRMVNAEFFSNFSCSCKRISFDDGSQLSLSNSNGWPRCSSSSALSSPLQNFLKHHCTYSFVSSSWAKCVVDVANFLH